MGLLSKKSPCPICGGKILWFSPWKIEGEYICNTCYSKIDMEADKAINMTMQGFREYIEFYEQNQLLKNKFIISQWIDFEDWDTKIIFDYHKKLFCMSKNPDKTIFKGRHLKSFTIKEDNTTLFEGSSDSIRRYSSTAAERVMALEPQITQYTISKMLNSSYGKLKKGKENQTTPMQSFIIQEPFKSFNVELHLKHPYWTVIKFSMDGPRLSREFPDVNEYIRDYKRRFEEIEKLVKAFKTVAFPEAVEIFIGFGATSPQEVYTTIKPLPIATRI